MSERHELLLPRRRTLIAGGAAGLAAWLASSGNAEADTRFVNFAFPATGAPNPRTMPDRLAEIKNVIDFGADPTGGNASATTAAIQAAVDSVAGANRGIIYFPYVLGGSYQVNAPITYNYDGPLSICFRGEAGTFIFGNVNGWIFDRHLPTATVTISIASPGVVTDTAHGKSANDPTRFETTGALPAGLLEGVTYYVKTVLSTNTYTVAATAGGTVIATSGTQSGVHTRAAVNSTGGRVFERLNISNSNANGGCIRIGSTDGGVIRDCKLAGFINVTTEDSVGISSRNIDIDACNFTNNGTVSGSHYIIIGGGGAIRGCLLSGADTAVRAYGSGLFIAGNRSENCNTSWLFGLDSGGNNVGLSGWSLTSCSAEGNWTSYYLAGTCSGFMMSAFGAQGHDAANAGVVKNIQGTQYSIRIDADCAQAGVIENCTFGNYHAVAVIAAANATARANLVIREVQALAGAGGGANWTLPTNAYTALIENSNTPAVWTFSQLPTGGNVLEGDEFNISDSTTAAWGANVTTGGGSNRVLVRWNGSNWTVVGI